MFLLFARRGDKQERRVSREEVEFMSSGISHCSANRSKGNDKYLVIILLVLRHVLRGLVTEPGHDREFIYFIKFVTLFIVPPYIMALGVDNQID